MKYNTIPGVNPAVCNYEQFITYSLLLSGFKDFSRAFFQAKTINNTCKYDMQILIIHQLYKMIPVDNCNKEYVYKLLFDNLEKFFCKPVMMSNKDIDYYVIGNLIK